MPMPAMPAKSTNATAPTTRIRHRLPNTIAMRTRNTATPSSIGRVPIHWISTKPVMNTPKMLPAVERGVYLADYIAGLCEASQPELDDYGRDHSQDDAGDKE